MKNKSFLSLALAFLFVFAAAVLAIGDVNLTGITSDSGLPGETADFTITIQNDGADTIPIIQFTSTALTSGSNTIPAPSIASLATLEPGAGNAKTQTFSLTIPAVSAGVYSATVTAAESGNSSNSDDEIYTLTVLPVTALDVLLDALEMSGEEGEGNIQANLNIKNIGSESVLPSGLTFEFTQDDFTDSRDREIGLTFNFADTSSIIAGTTRGVTIEVDIENNMKLGLYSGTIDLKKGSTILDSFELEVRVQPQICEDGPQGNDLSIDIEDPNDGDEFEPGETVDIKVRVDNDGSSDIDVIVEAILYNVDQDEKIADVESDSIEVQDGKDEDFNLEIEIPADEDLDEDDTYVLYVKAYEDGDEDKECVEDSIELKLERPKHQVIIKDVSFVPSAPTCGETLTVSVDIENTGTSKEDDVYVKLINAELNINEQSQTYDLDDYSDSDNDALVKFTLNLPTSAQEKSYTFKAYAYFDDGDENDLEEFTISLTGCDAVAGEASLTLPQSSIDNVNPGQSFQVAAKVKNLESTSKTFTVETTAIGGWADSAQETISLDANEEKTIYLTMRASSTLESGSQTVLVTLKSDATSVDSKTLTVNIVKGGDATSGGFTPTGAFTTFFGGDTKMSSVFWIIGDIVLVIVAIYFIVLIFRRNR